MSEVYHNPKYYELAFSFRDIPVEVDVFEALIKQSSRIPVSRVLELGCGPAPHLAELTRRGYTYVGLDLSRPMLAYAQQKADTVQASARFHVASMIDFRLDEPVDFAFILLGSLYARNTTELQSHFDAVGRALKHGGLYLLDWCVQFALPAERTESWEMSRENLTVKTTYRVRPINPVEQTVEEIITLEVDDADTQAVLRETVVRREIYPQEFLLLMASRTDFEFVGWWNHWDLTQPLDGTQPINRPIVVVRKV
ncbi:MAG TPA: class I SAM-dependent methyltransferase [Candidatus Binatia bacterium]|nr:class I SAM-dependent methyltransferase [Candidatus Binatia bacterium]